MGKTQYRFSPALGKQIAVEVIPPERRQADAKTAWADRFFGCPISWLLRVFPVVKSKHELVVAVYLHRRRVVCGNRKTIDVPNDELRRLGVSRWGKSRGLQNLAKAGFIAVGRRGNKSVTVTFLDPKRAPARKAKKAAPLVEAAGPRPKRAHPKPGESFAVAKPWLAEGISRRSWYRRRAAAKLRAA